MFMAFPNAKKICGMHRILNVFQVQLFSAENMFFKFFDKFFEVMEISFIIC